MAAAHLVALEQLSGELARTPSDQDILRRFADRCIDAGELGRLRQGLEPVLASLSGPLAVRPVADTLARALTEAAVKLEKRHPKEALELYLRAARVLATVANDRVGAARVLAAAWRTLPDERVALATQALFQGTGEPPDYTLVALAEVGEKAQKTQALRRLGAGALERRQLGEAEALFTRLDALMPGDADVAAGRQVVDELRRAASERVGVLGQELERATTRLERGLVMRRIGDAERGAGRYAEAKRAYAQALELGDEAALRPLEALHRELGELDGLCETLMRVAGPGSDASIGLKKKLFLLLEEVGRKDDAQRMLAAPRPLASKDKLDELRQSASASAAADPLRGALKLEEWAAQSDDRAGKLEALVEAARLAEKGREDGAPSALEERLWRKVRALDPQARGAADFYRDFYHRHPDPRRQYANLAQLHAITSDQGERRTIATEMATLAEASLGHLDKAIEAWRLVERDVPGDDAEAREERLLVWTELRRLYAAARRWHAYVDLVDRWIDAVPDTEDKVELLFDVVEVYQDPERLPMPAMVLQTYQRIVALVPSHPVALDRLAVSLAEREQWSDLLKVLGQKVELTTDTGELVALFHQIADLYLDHIRNEAQAVVVLERLLELDPDDLAVVKRLRELYRRRHDAERHFAALQRELELSIEESDRIAILEALAATAQQEFLQPERAAEFHRQILEIEPGREKSLEALQALHAEQEDWPAYTRVLEQRVAEAKTKSAKLPLLLELGECVLTRLGDVERAEQIFQTIAESSPTSAPARRFLQRIFVTRRKWDDLARLFAKPQKTSATGGPRWKDYVSLLKDAAKQEPDAALVSAIHVEIARVLEAELDDKKTAAEHLELALRDGEDDVDLARRMLELLGEDAPGPRRVTALQVIGRHAPDLAERYQAFLSLAQIHRRAKDPVSACDAWGKALVLGAELGLTEALPQLEEDAGATGRWESAYGAIDEALGRLPDGKKDARVAFHRSLGNIARTRLLKPEDAIRHFRWVLQLAPGDAFALEELEKLYYSHSDFAGLEEVYRARIDAAATPAERVPPLKALARLFDDVMLDPERASGVHAEVLHLAPDDRESFDALLRALEATKSWGELAAALEAGLTRVRDPAERQSLELRLAEIAADRLADPLTAIEHCRDVVERAAPGEPLDRPVAILERYARDPILARDAAPVLELAYRKLGRLAELAVMLEARAADATADELPPLLDEILMLLGGAEADPRKAFELLTRRFEAAPEDPDGWVELERAAAAVNGWEPLVETWKKALAVEPPPSAFAEVRPALRLRLAEVYHRRLIELEEAIVETERALADTTDEREKLAALESLEVLFKKTADLESFVRVKLESSRRVLSRSLRRQKVIEAAHALAGALGRPEDAIAVLEPLWLEEPADVELADQLVALNERVGDAKKIDQAYSDAIDAARSVERADALRYRRALARRDRMGLWEVAISELIGLVESPTSGKDARRALLEVSRAQESEDQRDVILEVLVEFYRRTGDAEGLINTLVVQAEFTPAGAERAAVLASAARECLPSLAEAAARPEEAQHAFDLYGQAIYEDPADAGSLDAMATIARSNGLWVELAEVIAFSVDANTAERDDAPPGVRALLREEARIAEIELDDDRRAIASLERELAYADSTGDEDIQPTLVTLERLYGRTGDYDARRLALQRLAGIQPDPLERAALFETLAGLELEIGHGDEAIATLQAALEVLEQVARDAARPARLRILGTLESVLRGAARFGELIELLIAVAADEPAELRRELLHRAAECASDDLRDADRAVALYDQLVAEDASDEVAVGRLVELHEEAGRWPAAIVALGRQRALADNAGAADEAREIAFRIGQIQADHLDAGDRAAAGQAAQAAIATFAEVLAGDPGHAGTLSALARLETKTPSAGPAARALLASAHRARGDAAQLAAVLEKVATFDAPPPSLLLELADLWMGPLAHPARAWPHVARGYALDPTGADGETCRQRLLELSRREPLTVASGLGAPPEQAQNARRLVQTLTEVGRAIATNDLRRKRKELDLSALGQLGIGPPEVVPAWRSTLAEEPKNPTVLALFEAWARAEGEPALLAEALEHRAASLPVNDRTPVELELAATLARAHGREGEALRVWRLVLARDPSQDAAFQGLSALLARLGRHVERAALITERLDKVPAAQSKRDALRLELAGVRWYDLHDGAGAVDLLSELGASQAPLDAAAIELLESIWSEGVERSRVYRLLEPPYQSAGDWDKLVALYTSTLEQDDPELQIECLTKLAELENVRLDKPEAAFTTLLALVERLPDDSSDAPRRLDELEGLARRLSRWDELVDRLEALVGLGHGGAALMARLARIHEIERGDPERAAYFYRFAFEHDPSDLASRDALSALLERSERWDDLARHLNEAADRSDTRARHELRLRAADVLDQRLSAPRRALPVLEQVTREAPPDDAAFVAANERIAGSLEKLQDYPALHRHYRAWLEQAASDEVAIDVQVRLGRSLIRFPQTAREGLTELEEVLRTVPARRDVVPALWSMIVACERAEMAAARNPAVVGATSEVPAAIDPQYAEATAEAAKILEGVVGENAPATTLAGIVQAQLRVLPPGAERQATLVRLARLMGDLDAPERAFQYLAEALRGDLESVAIESQLEAIAAEHNYWEALAGLYEESSANEDEHIAARYVLKVARILDERLKQPEEAASWFERHLAAVPGNRDAVVPLAKHYREVADAAAEARVLEAWIDFAATPDELPGLRMRLGVLRMDQLGDVQGAIDALEGCLPDGAADIELVRRLERLYIKGEHFAALVELYRAALQHVDGDKARLEILAKMAQVYETRLDDAATARDTSKKMLAIEPLNRFALTTLERIERAAGDWEAVEEVLAKKLEATPAEAARVRILIDRAEVAVQHRNRPDQAIDYLLEADKLWGSGPGPEELVKGLEVLLRSEPSVRRRAARALEKRYRPRAAWQPLINALLIELVASPDAGERFALATQAAQIAIEKLGDRALALRVLLAALRQAPEAPDLRALVEREAREANDFGAVLKTGEDMLKRGVPDAALIGFSLWLGGLERQHGDRAKAIKTFERVLEREPANAEAGEALAVLYRDAGDFAALRGIYHQRMAVEPADQQSVLKLDLALHLAESEGLERTLGAIEEIVAEHAGDPRLKLTLQARVGEAVAGAAATHVLAGGLRKEERWSELVKLLEARADKTLDPVEKSRLLREAGAVLETAVGDRVAAVHALARAADALPNDIGAWRQLRELSRRVAAVDDLARALRNGIGRAEPTVGAELSLWLAGLELAELKLPDGAEQAKRTLRSAIALAPDNVAVREALVKLELDSGDAAAAEEEISALTDRMDDDARARDWWRSLRSLAEKKGDEARMVAADEALLARDPNDTEAAEHLSTLYRNAQRWDDLVELLFLRIQNALAGEQPLVAARHWMEIAQVRNGPLADADGALDAWREGWTLDPSLPEATKKLVADASERGEWREVADLWEAHAQALPDPAGRAATLCELARVTDEKLRDPSAAIAAYERALEVEPTAVPALNALVSIFGRTRRFADLAATLERKAEAVQGAERSMVAVQAAAVYLDQLRDAARARPLLDAVLAREPDHLEGRLLLARLHVREGRAAEAAAALQDLAKRTEGKRRLRLLMDLARLLANEVGDVAAAVPVIDEALAIDPAAPGLDALAIDVLTQARAWARLRALLERYHQAAATATEQAERAFQLARTYSAETGGADGDAFAHWLDAVVAADPARAARPDVRILEVERLTLAGDDAGAEAALTEVVAHFEDQRAADAIAARSHQLGLVRERLGDVEGAIEAFARAHEIDGKNVRKLLDYGRVLIAGQRWNEALGVHQALLMQRQALANEDERHAVLERLALASWEAGQLDRARAYLNKLLGERADHPGGRELRARFGA